MLTSCGTTPTNYKQKQVIPKEDAIVILEQLLMTQHPDYRPNNIFINDEFLGLDFGSVTESNTFGSGTPIGNSYFTGSYTKTETTFVGSRHYFSDIEKIKLLSWKRKLKQWYVITTYNGQGQNTANIYRTRDLNRAKLFYDSFQSVLDANKKNTTLNKYQILQKYQNIMDKYQKESSN